MSNVNFKRIFEESLGGKSNDKVAEQVKNPIYNQYNMSVGLNTENDKEEEFANNQNAGMYKTNTNQEFFFQSLEKDANEMYDKVLGKEKQENKDIMRNSVSNSQMSLRSARLPISINPSDAIVFEAEQDLWCERYTAFDPSKDAEKRFVSKRLGLEDICKVEKKKSSSWLSALPVFTKNPIASSVNGINDLNEANKGSVRGMGLGEIKKYQSPNVKINYTPIHLQTKQYTFNNVKMDRLQGLLSVYGSNVAMAGYKILEDLTKQQIIDFFRTKFAYACIGAGIKSTKEGDATAWKSTTSIDDNEDSFEGLFNNSKMATINSTNALFKEVFGTSFSGFANASFKDIQNIFTQIALKMACNNQFGGANPYNKLRIATDFRTYLDLKQMFDPTNVVAGIDAVSTKSKLRLAYDVLDKTISQTSGYGAIDMGSIIIYPSKFLSAVNVLDKNTNDNYRQFSIGEYSFDNSKAEGSKYSYKRKMVIYDADKYVLPDVMSPTFMMSKKALGTIQNGEFVDSLYDRMSYAQVSSTDLECAIGYQYAGITTPDVEYNNGFIINFADETSPVDLDYIAFDNN